MKNLLDLIRQQSENVSRFSEILQKQQKSIINIELENLAAVLDEEERIIKEIRIKQTEIDESTAEECEKQELPSANLKMLISKKGDAELSLEMNLLKENLKEVIYLNEQNKILAENSRSFVKNFICQMVNNKQIFDRKI